MSYTPQQEKHLREEICRIGKLMRQYEYIDGMSGNISARLDDEHILTTPSGLAKGYMSPDQLIIVNMDGEKVGEGTPANQDLRPTSELSMHLECYKKRPDINGVVHAHPPTAVALTIAGVDFHTCTIPEAIVILGPIPITEYAMPSSTENRDAISDLIETHNVIMLAYHGSLTVGKDVWSAYLSLESVEHIAKIIHKTLQIGEPNPLPDYQIEKLLKMRRDMGLDLTSKNN